METTENGRINLDALIDSTSTYLTFQYLKQFQLYDLNYIEIIIPLEQENRRIRSLAVITATFEGRAYFNSELVPSDLEMAQVLTNAFNDDTEEGISLYIDLLKSTQDNILSSVKSVSADIIIDGSSGNSDASLGVTGTSMIPIIAGAISALVFLLGAIFLARKYDVFNSPDVNKSMEMNAKSPYPSPKPNKRSLPQSDIGSEFNFEADSLQDNDSYSIASSGFAYSMSFPPTNMPPASTAGSALGGYVSESDYEDEETVEEISLDERRFNSILGQKYPKKDFKSVWMEAKIPSTRLRNSRSVNQLDSRTFQTDDIDDLDDTFSDLASDLTGLSGLR